MKEEIGDGLELCDECGFEYDKKEIEKCTCGKQLCKLCIDLHSDEHYHNYQQNGEL